MREKIEISFWYSVDGASCLVLGVRVVLAFLLVQPIPLVGFYDEEGDTVEGTLDGHPLF